MQAVVAVVLVGLRYGLLFGARGLGWIRRVVFRSWGRVLVWLGLFDLGLWVLVRQEVIEKGLLADPWLEPDQVLPVLAAAALVSWILRARRRLVIGSFIDYRLAEPKPLPGLSALLHVELARLHDLVDVVNHSRAVPEVLQGRQSVAFDEQLTLEQADRNEDIMGDQPLDAPAPIVAEDLTDVLDAVVSVEATVSLGPLKIPIGVIASMVGQLARGPRVTGSVHSSGSGLVVTARTVGAGEARTWRVDAVPSPNGASLTGEPCPEDLLDELAVRIFTDLALEGLVKWHATWAYINGLRAYRSCLRTKKDRRLSLERAKDHFIETIAEDERFDLAHYNLGVVATELNQQEAAESAFLSAIDLNKMRWAPYYALAQLYFCQGRYEEVLPLCGRIIRLDLQRRHRAEGYHLRALAYRRKAAMPSTPKHLVASLTAAALRDRRAAVRWSWFRLCGAAFRGRGPEMRRLAATSLRNLGGMRAYNAKSRWPAKPRPTASNPDRERRPLGLRMGYFAAATEMRQGRFVNPSDAELHFELGKLYAARRRWKPAARQLERAIEIVPDRPRFWIQLARAYAGPRSERKRLACGDRAVFASNLARAQPSQIADTGFTRLLEVYDRLHRAKEAAELQAMQRFEKERKAWGPGTPPSTALQARLQDFNLEFWEVTQVCLHLAERYRKAPAEEHVALVAERLAAQLTKLSEHHPREVRQHEVYAVLAEALHAIGKDTDALRYAESAVVHDPLSTRARRVLATVHLSLEHFDQATAAWRAALVCDPDGADTNLALGECLVRSALSSHALDRRRAMLTEAIGYLENALKLSVFEGWVSDAEDLASRRDEMEGEARYWLGRAHFELDDYEQAVTQLQLCTAVRYEPMLTRLRLGVAYLRKGHLCEGERVLAEIEGLAQGGVDDDGSRAAGPAGDQVPVKEILVWARIHVASSRIDRDAGLEDAIDAIRQVKHELKPQGGEVAHTGPLAACADWEGWGRFKQDDHDAAIQSLDESIRLEPTPEAYLHLAQVYASRAIDRIAPAERYRDAARARHCADVARRLGLGMQQGKPLDEILRRLDAEHQRWAAEGVKHQETSRA